MADELLTVTEAAEKYRLARATIYKWVRAGAVTPIYVGPTGEMRIRASELVSSQKTPPPEKPE